MMLLLLFLRLVTGVELVVSNAKCLACMLMIPTTTALDDCCAVFARFWPDLPIGDDRAVVSAFVSNNCQFICSQLRLLERHGAKQDACELLSFCRHNGACFCLFVSAWLA